MNPDERDDELLQEYLEGDSELSRLYRHGAHEKPDPHLDARILGEARRAASHKGRVVHSPFSRHWLVPTSLAAVFVLSVSVVLLLPDPIGEPGVVIDEAETIAPSRGRMVGDAPGERADTQPAPASTSAPGADVVPLQSPSAKQRANDMPGKSSEKSQAQAAARKRTADDDAESLAAPGVGASDAENALPPPALESAQEPGLAPRPMPNASVQDNPAAWLRFIQALLDEQNQAAAKSNLRAFRARYPDFPLPASLDDLAASLDAQPP